MQLIKIRYAIIYFKVLCSFSDAIASPMGGLVCFGKQGQNGNSNFSCDYFVAAYPLIFSYLLGSTQST